MTLLALALAAEPDEPKPERVAPPPWSGHTTLVTNPGMAGVGIFQLGLMGTAERTLHDSGFAVGGSLLARSHVAHLSARAIGTTNLSVGRDLELGAWVGPGWRFKGREGKTDSLYLILGGDLRTASVTVDNPDREVDHQAKVLDGRFHPGLLLVSVEPITEHVGWHIQFFVPVAVHPLDALTQMVLGAGITLR